MESAAGGSGAGGSGLNPKPLRTSPRKKKEPEKERTLLHVLADDIKKLGTAAHLAKEDFKGILKKLGKNPSEEAIRKEQNRLERVISKKQIDAGKKLKSAKSITAALDVASQELALAEKLGTGIPSFQRRPDLSQSQSQSQAEAAQAYEPREITPMIPDPRPKTSVETVEITAMVVVDDDDLIDDLIPR